MKSVVPAANIRRKRAATRRPCTESSQNATKTKRDLICPVLIQHIFPPYSPEGKQDSFTELDWIVPAGFGSEIVLLAKDSRKGPEAERLELP